MHAALITTISLLALGACSKMKPAPPIADPGDVTKPVPSVVQDGKPAVPVTQDSKNSKPAPPIVYDGTISVTPNTYGGLRPALGTQNIQVYRANRASPSHRDGLNHTYLHAPMLAYWHSKFYLSYLSAPINEHDSPTPTSLVTSGDGIHWDAPVTLFPAYELPDGSRPVTHQRMGFYVAPNDTLIASAFYGFAPRPNDGSGIGRAVREVKNDGSLGPIYFIRYNSQAGWNPKNAAKYPFYTQSPDKDFVAACNALLANKLMTAQWWEEDRSKDGFYREQGKKALSYYHLPSGTVVGIWKQAATMTSDDDGASWKPTGAATNLPASTSKFWAQKTADNRYALVFNPTRRLRHPLALATSSDGRSFSGLLAVHGELPDQRFPGKYKNMGPQYVRGILEGNGKPPNLWVTYSVNKEDIWVSRVPVPVTQTATSAVFDDFEGKNSDGLPANWNVYRPLWAPSQVVDSGSERGSVLQLSDEDPCDYASVTRLFPETRSTLIRFKLLAKQVQGRLEVDVANGAGLRPVQVAFTEKGNIEARHEGIWKPAGPYQPGKWMDVEIDVNPGAEVDRFQFRINGKEVLLRAAYSTELAETVERLTFRTGKFRRRGVGGHAIAHADFKSPKSSFLIDEVSIAPRP